MFLFETKLKEYIYLNFMLDTNTSYYFEINEEYRTLLLSSILTWFRKDNYLNYNFDILCCNNKIIFKIEENKNNKIICYNIKNIQRLEKLKHARIIQ